MPMQLKEDVAYILLRKLEEQASKECSLRFTSNDFVGRNTDKTEILAHLDYLNQKGYISVDFDGDAYADKGPNPVPDSVELKAAKLTSSGKELLDKMSQKIPAELREGPSVEIATKDMDFLKKVMLKGNVPDMYDARDLTEIVFRTMRDLMGNQTTKRVADELHTEAIQTDKKAAREEISELWKDSNPLVRFLSEIRPALNFDDETFLFRVEKEGGLPKSTGPETVVKAVFGATKDELSAERISEISNAMPGRVRELWEQA